MKVSQIVTYEYAGVTYETEQGALNQKRLVEESLGERIYILNTKPDLRDGLGYYEKNIVVVKDLPSFKKYLKELSETVPSNAKAYSLEGPYFFEREEDLAGFVSMEYSVGIGRYTTTKKLSIMKF